MKLCGTVISGLGLIAPPSLYTHLQLQRDFCRSIHKVSSPPPHPLNNSRSKNLARLLSSWRQANLPCHSKPLRLLFRQETIRSITITWLYTKWSVIPNTDMNFRWSGTIPSLTTFRKTLTILICIGQALNNNQMTSCHQVQTFESMRKCSPHISRSR